MSVLPNTHKLFSLARITLLFFSVLPFLLVEAEATSEHCLNEALVLSTELACFLNGLGDLLSNIGQSLQPIRVDVQVENSDNAEFSLWSYKPVCTEIIEEIGSKLCVYTNIAFGGGRGISIFTTPLIAEEFAALPPFRNSKALDGINIADGPWYTQKLPGKGTGVLAKRKLKRGDLIAAYTPVLLVHRETALSTRNRENILRIAVDQLPPATRESYLSLATSFGDPTLIIQDVVDTNAYEIQVGGEMHLAIFPEPSRINHDCAPNSQYHLEPSLLTYFVHAARSIPKDQEITVSYLKPFYPHANRQEYLLEAFRFTCRCSRCRSKGKSDAALAQMLSLEVALGDWSPESTATTKKAEKLIKLYKEQGLDGFLNSAYGFAALTYNAIGDAQRARKYADLAAQAVAMKDGPAAPDFKMWNEILENPAGHWSWRWRRR